MRGARVETGESELLRRLTIRRIRQILGAGTGPKTSRGAHLRIRRRNPEQHLYSRL
jgi:hypothetical protein